MPEEEAEQKKLERQAATMNRLGIYYDTPGVDPENVVGFAKAFRVIGIIVLGIFIGWGAFYDWSYSRSPFEQLFKEFGVRSNDEEWAAGLAVIISLIGWRYRFLIGVSVSTVYFWGIRMLKRIFRSI